jgi:hypothetical protein
MHHNLDALEHAELCSALPWGMSTSYPTEPFGNSLPVSAMPVFLCYGLIFMAAAILAATANKDSLVNG